MHALPLLVGALCVVAIAYRYYSAVDRLGGLGRPRAPEPPLAPAAQVRLRS